MTVPTGFGQTVYEADPSFMQAVHHCRERIRQVCRQHMNRRVRVRAANGMTIDGVLVGGDDYWLYLDTASAGMARQP